MIEVLRGDRVESRHSVHVAVVDERGCVVASVGDPGLQAFYRSAAKPFQALPLVEDGVVERFGITDEELALCCGSHEGEPAHVAGARSILARAGLDESALRCGTHPPFSETAARALARDGEAARRVHNNCSGKHAGMLALARAHRWDPEGYHLGGHPVQRRMLAEIARWTGMERGEIGIGVDGCGVLCFSVPLRAMGASFARFAGAAARGEAARRVAGAMTAHPFMVGGTKRACTAVMERTAGAGGAFVKVGAEGVYGAGLPDRGWGVALKVEDGARRAAEATLVHVLHRMDVLDGEDMEALARWASPQVRNTLGDVVGEIRPAFDLAWT